METYTYTVVVQAKDSEQAAQIMVDKIFGQDEYGFDYIIDFHVAG